MGAAEPRGWHQVLRFQGLKSAIYLSKIHLVNKGNSMNAENL